MKRFTSLRKFSSSQNLYKKNEELSEREKIFLQNKLEVIRADHRAHHEWKILIFDKLVWGILAIFLAVMGQKFIAQYQDKNTIHQMNLTLAKNAFKDVWPFLSEYQMAVENMGSTMRSMSLSRDIFKERLDQDRSKFDKEVLIANEKFHLAYVAIRKQQHLLGVFITGRAIDYLRYERFIASIYEQQRENDGKNLSEPINADAIKATEKMIAELQTNLLDIDKIFSSEK